MINTAEKERSLNNKKGIKIQMNNKHFSVLWIILKLRTKFAL